MRFTIIILILALTSLSYQNCSSSFSAHHTEEQASVMSAPSQLNADLFWDMASADGVTLSRLSQVESWADRTGNNVVLFPPLANANMVNMDRAPLISQTSTGSLVAFSANQSLQLQGGNVLRLVSSEYTVAIYITRLQFSASERVARVLSLIPADNSQTGYLGIDIHEVDAENARINAFEYFDGANVQSASLTVPIASLSTGLSIVVRFSNDPAQMRMTVNGTPATLSTHGNPPLLGNVARVLTLNGPDHGQGSFLMAGLALWKSELEDSQIDDLSLSMRSYYESGGSTTIGYNPTPGNNPSTGPRYSSVQGSLAVCTNCHTQVNSRALILGARGSNGVTPWIQPGNSANSLLIKALQHQGGVLPMPRNSAQLSSSTIAQIAAWIDAGAN